MPDKIARETKLNNRTSHEHTIKVVVLAGGRDYGRCPLASQLPTALWPIAGKPVLEHLLRSLADQGTEQATICFRGECSSLRQWIKENIHLKLKFFDEQLPMGSAGCVRDAAGDETDALLVVSSATILCPPKIDALVKAHQDGKADLTVIFDPGGEDRRAAGDAADIFVCSSGILEYVPKDGYFDIKEGLIPEMVRVGKSVHTVTLPKPAGNFRDRQSYLNAIANYLENGPGHS